MPIFKGQFFINEYAQGWVEQWYQLDSDIGGAVAGFSALGQALMGPKSADAVLTGCRVLQVAPPLPRMTQRIPFNADGGRPPGGAGTGNEDVTSTAALMIATFTSTSQKPRLIRGLADDDVLRDPQTGAARPASGLTTALNSFASSLRSNQMGEFGHSTLTCSSAVTMVGSGSTPNTTELTLSNNTGFIVGQRVSFTGVPKVALPWLKGTWTIMALNGNIITLAYPYNLAAPTHPISMVANVWTYGLFLFQSWTFEDFRIRKTGRPTSLTRGRSAGIPYRRSIRAVG